MAIGKNKKIKYIVVSVIAVLLIAAIFTVSILWDVKFGAADSVQVRDDGVLEFDGTEYVFKDGVETFLIIGLDKLEENVSKDSYNNNQQADFLMLMVFDNNEKKYSAIHINRDTIVEMDVLGLAGKKVGTVKTQIALSHTYGGGSSASNNNTAKAVANLLYGVDVDHYMSLTLDSIEVMNELVGGVTLEVLDDFSGIDSEAAEGLIKGETVTLTEEQALLYVQSRKDIEDGSNALRMERQQQYVEAMRVQIIQRLEEDETFLADAIIKLADYMDSDCSAERLKKMGAKMQDYEFAEINDIEGESIVGEDGHMEFYPNEETLVKTVIDLFYVPKK